MGHHLFSLRGVHELCINREGSALQLKRWSQSERCGKPWALLCFLTWEGMYAWIRNGPSPRLGLT